MTEAIAAQKAAENAVVPVREGSRWRWLRPSSEEVNEWFGLQRLDEGMEHAHYVSGITIIGAKEKVTKPFGDQGATREANEPIYVPYVQINTRLAYFHAFAELRGLIPVIEPVPVPRIAARDSAYYNEHMEEGMWWHVIATQGGGQTRYLCATWRVALYKPDHYERVIAGHKMPPVREGRGTKQAKGFVDDNAVMKAQTGAIGRALGVAGILVVGTGIATAEDMQEAQGTLSTPTTAPGPPGGDGAPPASVEAPETVDPQEALKKLRGQVTELQDVMKAETPDAWTEFAAWWTERSRASGWAELKEVPLEALRGVVVRMERGLDAARLAATNASTQVEG